MRTRLADYRPGRKYVDKSSLTVERSIVSANLVYLALHSGGSSQRAIEMWGSRGRQGPTWLLTKSLAIILGAAGILPGSVQTRYDLSGTYVHERLQYTY